MTPAVALTLLLVIILVSRSSVAWVCTVHDRFLICLMCVCKYTMKRFSTILAFIFRKIDVLRILFFANLLYHLSRIVATVK